MTDAAEWKPPFVCGALARRAIRAYGVKSDEEFLRLTVAQVLAVKGCGVTAVRQIESAQRAMISTKSKKTALRDLVEAVQRVNDLQRTVGPRWRVVMGESGLYVARKITEEDFKEEVMK